jgi:hypothetical protein
MKTFCFTVDDNIRCLKEITESGCESIFDHPYLAMYRRLHEQFDLKVQLNLFYRCGGFDLSMMSDKYRAEWEQNADWLKLSFHSELENVKPYEFSGYDEVYADCRRVHEQILRFASEASLAKTTTIHFCEATEEGLKALKDNGVRGLLGLYGTPEKPRYSYGIRDGEQVEKLRGGEILKLDGICHGSIDIILNLFSKSQILEQLRELLSREHIRVMIHEQYFYPDYPRYQPDFEEKIGAAFRFLTENGYRSSFFEEITGVDEKFE